MNDPVADIARATAGRVSSDRRPAFLQEVEVALLTRDNATRAETYAIDLVSLGSLIVAITTLAWTIHNDIQMRARRLDPDVLARTIRARLRVEGAPESPDRDRIVDIVVEETARVGTAHKHEQ